MVKLVLFDIDGTLIRSGGAGVRAFEKTFADVFGLRDATQTLKFAGRTDVSLVRECLSLHGVDPSEENFRRFFQAYPANLEHFLRSLPGAVLPGVENLITDLLRSKDPPAIGLLTGNVRRGAELKLRHYGLWDRFEFGAFADDHEDRNCIASIARERGSKRVGRELAGEEIVVIGDTPLDIACGKSIGAKTLAVSTGAHSREVLADAKPTWAVENLTKIRTEEILGRG